MELSIAQESDVPVARVKASSFFLDDVDAGDDVGGATATPPAAAVDNSAAAPPAAAAADPLVLARGWDVESAQSSAVCLQRHARGRLDRRRVLRQDTEQVRREQLVLDQQLDVFKTLRWLHALPSTS